MIDFPEPEKLETLEDVVKQLQSHREIHARWCEWHEENPDDTSYAYAGDLSHHIHVIGRYDKMIELIKGEIEDGVAAERLKSLSAENECLQNARDAMKWIITDTCSKAPEQVTVELLSSYITKLQGTLEKND